VPQPALSASLALAATSSLTSHWAYAVGDFLLACFDPKVPDDGFTGLSKDSRGFCVKQEEWGVESIANYCLCNGNYAVKRVA
jgi:hypothetical protein